METFKKTFLVTGGAGFIGSHLSERLISNGHRVVCFDNLSTGKLGNIYFMQDKNPDFIFVKGDANNFQDLETVFKNNRFDGIFHYAAVVGVKKTIENPESVLDDIQGIKNVLRLALENGKPKVIFASSSEVYGEPKELPECEDGCVNPKLPYAVVKLTGEKYLETYWQKYGLKTCSLRFFNVYGPRQENSDYGFVVGIFVKQVMNGKNPTVFGDGSQTRDFVYIKDNIEACIRAMESDEANGQIINIGTGRPLTIYDLANCIIACFGKQQNLKPEFVNINREDVRHRFPEIRKMIKVLKYHPQFGISEGLREMALYYKSQNDRS